MHSLIAPITPFVDPALLFAKIRVMNAMEDYWCENPDNIPGDFSWLVDARSFPVRVTMYRQSPGSMPVLFKRLYTQFGDRIVVAIASPDTVADDPPLNPLTDYNYRSEVLREGARHTVEAENWALKNLRAKTRELRARAEQR